MKKLLLAVVVLISYSYTPLIAQSHSYEDIENLEAKDLGLIYSEREAVGYYALYNNGKAGGGEESKVLRFSDLQLQNDKVTDIITKKKGSVVSVLANSECYFVHFESKGREVTFTTFTKEGKLKKELDYGELKTGMEERSVIYEIQTLGEDAFIVWEKIFFTKRTGASQRYKYTVYSNDLQLLYMFESSEVGASENSALVFTDAKYFGIHETGLQPSGGFEQGKPNDQMKALKKSIKEVRNGGMALQLFDTLKIFNSITGKEVCGISTGFVPVECNFDESTNEISLVNSLPSKNYSVDQLFYDYAIVRYDLKGNKTFEKTIVTDKEFPELRKIVKTEKCGMVTNDIFLLGDKWIIAGELFEVDGADVIARNAYVLQLSEDFNLETHSTFTKTGKKIPFEKPFFFREIQPIIASKRLEFSYVSKDENDNCNIVYEVYKDIKDNIIEKEKTLLAI